MKNVLVSLALLFCMVALGGWAFGHAGYRTGAVITRPAIIALLLVSVAHGLVEWRTVRRGRLLVPVCRTGTSPDRNLEACEFHLARRVPYTVVLASLGGAPILLVAGLLVMHLAAPNAVAAGVVTALGAVVAIPSVVLLWCARSAWNARVALTRTGVTVRMLFARGTFTWDELIGFERVALRDNQGTERWWLRFVTTRQAYLFPDEVNDRETLINTITQATGLKLVNASQKGANVYLSATDKH